MTYGQKYVIRWTPRLKKKLLTIVAIIFIIGIVLGFMLGRVSAVDAKDDVAEVTKAPVTSTPLIVEVTEPPTESTAEQVVIVPVEKRVEYFDVPLSKDLQDYIFTLCEQNNVPVALIMQNGKINPVSGIFLGKNNFGYQDKTEMVLTPNSRNDSDYDAEDIKKRYLTDSTTFDSDSDSDS